VQRDDWKHITEALPDGLMVLDAQANIVAVNPAFSRTTGFSAQEIVGRSCAVLECSTCPQPGSAGCVLSGGGSGETVSCDMTHKSGRTLHLWKRASLLTAADGSILGAVETLIEAAQVTTGLTLIPLSTSLNDAEHRLVGKSPAMTALVDALPGLSQSDSPILIQGESGSGKELAARLLHQQGPRSAQPIVKLGCAILQPHDFKREPWVGEARPGNDLILDELSDLPAVSQKRLAALLAQDWPKGLRLLALTNRDLGGLAEQKLFDRDLWQRLRPVTINVPPLRERREDLPLLIDRLLSDLCLRQGRPQTKLSRQAMELMLAHTWPGNVRELINALDYALMLRPQGYIEPAHLPPGIIGAPPGQNDPSMQCGERQRLVLALRRAGGNQSEAARLLGVSRVTVWKRMQRYGINPKNL
jgi:two-component system, NtrC family, response regulator HydG